MKLQVGGFTGWRVIVVAMLTLALIGSSCSGGESADAATPDATDAAATATPEPRPVSPTATSVPATALPSPTPVPDVPTATVADIEALVLADYEAAALAARERVTPVIASSSLESVTIDDCIWDDDIYNTTRRTTYAITGTTTSDIAATVADATDGGDCLSDAMVESVLAFLEAEAAFTDELYANPDPSNPDIDVFFDEDTAANVRNTLAELVELELSGRSSGGYPTELVAWLRPAEVVGLLGVVYCTQMESDYGIYDSDGLRVGLGPEGHPGTDRFLYTELVMGESEFQWHGSGRSGMTWTTGCTSEEFLGKARAWQDLDFFVQ